jgi:hypothetical protein
MLSMLSRLAVRSTRGILNKSIFLLSRLLKLCTRNNIARDDFKIKITNP